MKRPLITISKARRAEGQRKEVVDVVIKGDDVLWSVKSTWVPFYPSCGRFLRFQERGGEREKEREGGKRERERGGKRERERERERERGGKGREKERGRERKWERTHTHTHTHTHLTW